MKSCSKHNGYVFKYDGDACPRCVAKNPEVEHTIKERSGKYGDWMQQGQLSDEIIAVLEKGDSWNLMPGWMRQGYRMIAEKMARAATGDHMYADNLHDIAGYASITEERLHRMKESERQFVLPEFDAQRHVEGVAVYGIPAIVTDRRDPEVKVKYRSIGISRCAMHGAQYLTEDGKCPLCPTARGATNPDAYE